MNEINDRMLSGKHCLLQKNQFCLFGINCKGECFEKWKENRDEEV